jgi:hypothetical protein
MEVGEAAGLAAALATRGGTTPARLDPERLTRTLADRRFLLSFFNDVKAGGDDTWIPAVQYFGTRGFFPTYDASPGRPLTREVARHWAKMFASMAAGRLDPMAEARALHTPGASPDDATTVADFSSLLERALADVGMPAEAIREAAKSLGLGPDSAIDRARACELMYRARSHS